MWDIIKYIQLDKVYWWWLKKVTVIWDYFFLSWQHTYREMTLTQLLFDVDSWFLESLRWRYANDEILIRNLFGLISPIEWMRCYENTTEFNKMRLSLLKSDEQRLQYIKDNALLPN